MEGQSYYVYGYYFLSLGILFEIAGLTALKECQGFTRFFPTLLFAAGIAASFYCESLALRTLPIGMIYAVWASAGIVGMLLVGALFYGESLSVGSVIGVILVVTGVTVMLCATPDAAEASVEV